jgi:hypothetical protein
VLPTKLPLDLYPYPRDPRSRPYQPGLRAGTYVYVQEGSGQVWISPDGNHMHPKTLGGARPAAAAGELIVDDAGRIVEVNNISGTFQFGPETLSVVIAALERQGATVADAAAHPFYWEA